MIINTRYSVFISKAPQWNMGNCQTLNIYSPASRRALTDRGYTPGFFSVIIFICHTQIYLFTISPITLNNSLRIHLLTTVWTLSLFWVFICPSPIPPQKKQQKNTTNTFILSVLIRLPSKLYTFIFSLVNLVQQIFMKTSKVAQVCPRSVMRTKAYVSDIG